MKTIVILAEEWGPINGGINSFNLDFTIALGRFLQGRINIVCVVKSIAVPAPKMTFDHVNVISIEKPGPQKFDQSFEKEVYLTLSDYKVKDVEWWIGHDVRTGHLAVKLKQRSNSGKVALINHMSYEHYETLGGDFVAADQKVIEQRNLFHQADHIFAIGPLLHQSISSAIGERGITVTQLIPGLTELNTRQPPAAFKAITYGRYSKKNDNLKQMLLGIDAFADALNWADDPSNRFQGEFKFQPHLFAIGVDLKHEELSELQRRVFSRAGKRFNLWPLPYTTDRQELMNKLRESSLAMMLSWHEGFGLAGWEAISAEVPLILSQHSGLWKFIFQQCNGLANGLVKVVNIKGGADIYSDQDRECVKNAILDIASDVKTAKTFASDLKDLLLNPKAGDGCTWENSVRSFLVALNLIDPVSKSSPFKKRETALYASKEVKTRLVESGLTSLIAIDYSIKLVNLTLDQNSALKVEVKMPVSAHGTHSNLRLHALHPSLAELELSINEYTPEIKQYIKNHSGFAPDGNPATWKIGVELVRRGFEMLDELHAVIIIKPLSYRVTNIFNRQIIHWRNSLAGGSLLLSESIGKLYETALKALLKDPHSFHFQCPSQLFVELVILSKDNNIVLFKKDRSGTGVVASLGMSWTCGPEIGLTFENLKTDNSLDLAAAIRKSLEKEFGIHSDELTSWKISGLALQLVHLNCALYGSCSVNLTAEEICARFMQNKSDQFVVVPESPKPYPEIYHVSELRNILSQEQRHDGEFWHPTAKIRLFSLLT